MITIKDVSLKKYTLNSLPRIKKLRELSFTRKPEICIERARYITKYLRYLDNQKDSSEIRQARKVSYFLNHKDILFHDRNLLAGTTTSKPLGAPLFPEFFALTLWPELDTVSYRKNNPQKLSKKDAEELNHKIFPFWMDKNILEVTRKQIGEKRCLKLFEGLAFFIASKAGCISHAVPTYTVMLENGLLQIINDIKAKEQNALTKKTEDGNRQADFFKAVQISLQGIVSYADNLAKEAQYLADITNDHKIKKEFLEIANVCKQVPAYPARTFREAVNAFWICQIGIHGENINMAMSPGRLDQVLYPWYRHDVEEGSINIKDAMEIIACLWFKLSDNVIMVPEASESLFGGAGTVPAVTLGGVDAKGEDAVNDLTYIMLRVTELLKIRDPNVNARYHFEKNTKQYINRVSEVLVNTQAVPAFFNDKANIKALEGQGETTEHARDYAIVGCVELSSSGRDYPASSSIMLNLAAPMEMTLFEGKRPITGDQQIGPATPAIDKINSFKDFQNAFITQLDWLINQAIELNEYFGATHQDIMPSPLLSAFFHGPLQKGKDIINGGAIYNSSGATHIGFADVVDSLSAIEYIVFIKQRFTLKEVVQAVKRNFNTKEDLIIYQYLKNHTPRYGTEHPISQKNADYLIDHLYKKYQSNINYRGGPYRPAYWSMTNHAGLGKISYALPHGRKKGEVFASGITPVSEVVPELTACLNSVAKLDAEKIPGCLALNIKYTPEPDKEKMIKKFVQTIQAYFKSGGQQVQFNIMDYKMLEDAKKNPDKYPQLLVRVSGYSAYFKDLNDKMKDELITRTQYNLISGKAEQII